MPGVGNDVVDLHDPDNRGKSGDDRFLGRVFTAEERALIAGAAVPDRLLWSLWAAKEAAYKAVSGADPPPHTIPRRYPVHIGTHSRRAPVADPISPCPTLVRSATDTACLAGAEDQSALLFVGEVITPRGAVALRVTGNDDYVHALAALPDIDFAGIVSRVDRREDGANPGDASAFGRAQLLAEISRRLNCPRDELTLRPDPSGSGAPRLFRRNLPLFLAISLSHDGRFTAFAFLVR